MKRCLAILFLLAACGSKPTPATTAPDNAAPEEAPAKSSWWCFTDSYASLVECKTDQAECDELATSVSAEEPCREASEVWCASSPDNPPSCADSESACADLETAMEQNGVGVEQHCAKHD